MALGINEHDEVEKLRAISEDNCHVSRTCEYTKNQMHHIHHTCEILLVEEGVVDYFIGAQKYHLEPYSILVISAQAYHRRHIVELPYLRCGLTIKPVYYEQIVLDHDLQKVFQTPSVEVFEKYYKKIQPERFAQLVGLFEQLKEEMTGEVFNLQMQKVLLTQIAIMLFRTLKMEVTKSTTTPIAETMQAIKKYIELHFKESLHLEALSKMFYLHPTTISKEFTKYSGYTLNKYIHIVRICEATRLLETTYDGMEYIAVACGYESTNTFMRQFKVIMQITPYQYRKSIRETKRLDK